MEGWARDALTVVVGVAAGVLSGMLGIGGAVLSTPGVRLLGASPIDAIGSTIPSILPSAVTGTITYSRERLVEWKVAVLSGAIGTVFALVGARSTPAIPGRGHYQQILTAGLLAFSAWRLLARRGGAAEIAEATPARFSVPRVAAIGVAAGLVAGLLGIGGGAVMVPAFTEVVKLRIKRAIATSLVVVGILAVPSAIVHSALGNIDWRFAAWLTVGIVPGARIGSAITVGAHERTVRRLFGGLLLALSAVYATAETISLARA